MKYIGKHCHRNGRERGSLGIFYGRKRTRAARLRHDALPGGQENDNAGAVYTVPA